MPEKLQNAKCHRVDLELFDELAKHEDSIPKNRPEMFARMVKGYAEYQQLKNNPPKPAIKEVEKIVYVDKLDQSSQLEKAKRKFISNGTWLLKNLQIFPTSHNIETRNKVSEIIEIANSL